MMGLPYVEEMMIVGQTMWTQCTSVKDRWMDRITITKTVQRRASHGKNTVVEPWLNSGSSMVFWIWLNHKVNHGKTVRSTVVDHGYG